MSSLIETITTTFETRFGHTPHIIARAPGRVNLIGEHTDYTGGFVLPVAIDRDVVIAASRTDDNTITGYSIDFDEQASITAGNYDPTHPMGWLRYVMGVLDQLAQSGRDIGGFRFVIGGDVPIGAGLSSSAATEMAVAAAMEGLWQFRMDDMTAALLCQRAENAFVGMNCGIMDQYISRIGQAGHAALIDCSDLSTRAVPINLPGWTWLIIDSKKRRGLVDSEYNRRREECEAGLRAAQTAFPERTITGLRSLAVDDLALLEQSCDPEVFKRVRHVITENDRVLRAVDALEQGDAEAVGVCLYGSHASLRDDFEVSCAELDMLVDILAGIDGVAGARLTGAGFGGCVICLVRENLVKDVTRTITDSYRPESLPQGTRADSWPVSVSDGAECFSTR